MILVAWALARAGSTQTVARQPQLTSEGLTGYIGMDVPANSEEFGYGVSLYAAAWPLLKRPLRDFQIGLASIWIVPENRKIEYSLLPTGTLARDHWPERGPSYRDVFQTIEGGLGFWANTRYWTSTAKFRMNGTPDGYNHEISSPGWGFGGNGDGGDAKSLPPDQMGIAQLSNHLLIPPDGVTLKPGTFGQLLGYAWMALPLTKSKMATSGVSTGDQSWTLFLNSTNFKGPVAFYTPATWSRISRRHPPAVGRGLDERPGLVTGGAIEVNTVPRFTGVSSGKNYSRIPQLQFPADRSGRTVLIHNLTHYSKNALYRSMQAWAAGGVAPTGRFDPKGAITPQCKAWPLSVKQAGISIAGVEDWVEPTDPDSTTFGLQWKPRALSPGKGGVWHATFPDFFRQDGDHMKAILAKDVPDDTGLKVAKFREANDETPYTSPEGPTSTWRNPGPKSGPHYKKLADGSVVTFYWYRFIDQPALQNADLSGPDKLRLQTLVEKIQANWTMHREYMAAPKIGTLAALDAGQLVQPPNGLEVGYVPIATHQTPPKPQDRNK